MGDAFVELNHREALKITLGVLLPLFLGSLDQTIVGAALPAMGRDFGDLQNVPWVATAYLITGAAVTPVVGNLSDIHGRRATCSRPLPSFWSARSSQRSRRASSSSSSDAPSRALAAAA